MLLLFIYVYPMYIAVKLLKNLKKIENEILRSYVKYLSIGLIVFVNSMFAEAFLEISLFLIFYYIRINHSIFHY